MASCTSCKKRTTSFCYVHKVAVCDDCIVSPRDPQLSRCEPNCVIRNYFDWLADGDYDFPPHCSLCNRVVTAEPANALRLVCKCLFHPPCIADALSKRRSDVVPLIDNRGLRCPTCGAAVYDPHLQARTKLREQVVRFLEAVDGKESIAEDAAITNGRHHHAAGDSTKSSHAASNADAASATSSSATAHTAPPSASPALSSASSASSTSSSSPFVPPLSITPPPLRAVSQPSRQRSSANLNPAASASASSSATTIDIGEEKAAPSLFGRSVKGRGRAVSGRRAGGSSLCRWRLDRVIGCIMLLCFLGSVVLYLMLSNQWLEPTRLSRQG